MVENKHPFAGYPGVKHVKHSNFAITEPVNFFYCSTQAPTLVSAIILQTQIHSQKFPFLFIFIIPCTKDWALLYSSYIIDTNLRDNGLTIQTHHRQVFNTLFNHINSIQRLTISFYLIYIISQV